VNQIPILDKLILVKIKPLQHETQRPLREIPVYDSTLDIDRNLVLPIDGMEMHRQMIPWEDADYYTKKSRYLRHLSVALWDSLYDVNFTT